MSSAKALGFQNALRIMWNLDRHDLVEHGVIEAGDEAAWNAFRDNPHDAAIRFGDDRFARLFALIERRQPRIEAAAPTETRYDDPGFVEVINSDVPYIIREIDGRVAIILEMETRQVIGYRVYGPARAAPSRYHFTDDNPIHVNDADGHWHQIGSGWLAITEAEYSTLAAGEAAEISIKPMRLSDDRCDYFVSFKHGDREVTPHCFRERFKAEYHVALYRWLFGQDDEPSIREFDEGDWPARQYTDEERQAFAALGEVTPDNTVFRIEHDGFEGTRQGSYITREGKRGVVLQQVGTKIVHVYGEKWLSPVAMPEQLQ